MAFGEPLAFSVLARAGVSAAEVEAAERAGLLSTEEAGTDIRVRLEHPLFGEVIRSQAPQLRRRTVHTTLAEAAGSVGGLRSEDAVRIAVWHLEAGTLPEPSLLVAAAGWALAALDYQLAEQFCRGAGKRDPAGLPNGSWRRHSSARARRARPKLLSGQSRRRVPKPSGRKSPVSGAQLYWGLNQPDGPGPCSTRRQGTLRGQRSVRA